MRSSRDAEGYSPLADGGNGTSDLRGAVARWRAGGRESCRYIFWENGAPQTKSSERLAIGHAAVHDQEFFATYAEVLEMLRAKSFNRIPGFSARHQDAIAGALSACVEDVDLDRHGRAMKEEAH